MVDVGLGSVSSRVGCWFDVFVTVRLARAAHL